MLDEPTEGIQPSIIKDIGRVIRMLADRGTMAIVLVEQYYDFAAGTGRPVPGDGARRSHRPRHGRFSLLVWAIGVAQPCATPAEVTPSIA
jgi:hypothetical protein